MRGPLMVLVLAAIVAVSGGCTSDGSPAPGPTAAGPTAAPPAAAAADNTAEICAGYLAAVRPYLTGEAPEAVAYGKLTADEYVGKKVSASKKAAVTKAFWTAQEVAVRPFADRAEDPALRTALTRYADELIEKAAGNRFDGIASDATMSLLQLCHRPSSTP
jgi:hypothetical protein